MKKFFGVALLVLTLASCKKEITELPEATETGANTFGAKLDGTFWGPRKFGIAPTTPILEARFSINNSVYINARDFSSSPTETEFEIYLQNVTGPGTIFLNQNTGNYPNNNASYAYYIKRKFMPLNEWITSTQYTGVVNVTRFDVVNRIVSGTFEFMAGSTDGTAAPINVTEGRFDVKVQ